MEEDDSLADSDDIVMTEEIVGCGELCAYAKRTKAIEKRSLMIKEDPAITNRRAVYFGNRE